jgi:hypothetical protein
MKAGSFDDGALSITFLTRLTEKPKAFRARFSENRPETLFTFNSFLENVIVKLLRFKPVFPKTPLKRN